MLCEEVARIFLSKIANYYKQLILQRTNSIKYGNRPFSIAAPKLWNDIPNRIRQPAVEQFKQK